ncbi:MAG: tetratricopeptide repeat protein [Bacteroidales bacterium]|nr:tetratricopeptide repeat protein [Bacteroidales bacterium]
MKKQYILLLLVTLLFAWPCQAQYDKDVFFFRGRQALADGKFSTAIDNFNTFVRLDTTDHWAFFFRGIAKYNLGDVRGAQKDFNTSVRLNPVFTSGYHYRAITESRFGDYEKALEDLERAISLRPGYEGLYFSRGVTYFLSQQFDKAVDDFDRYIRKQPKDPAAYLNRGASKLFLADTVMAMADYNKAISLDRREPEGYLRRGRLYALMGDYAAAISDMDKAVSLDSTNTFAYFNRALMYYEQKDYNAAMTDLNTVLRYEPGNALTLYNRSLIHAQVGNFEAALDDMDRVININPRNVLAYFNRASFFLQMERWRDALEDYDKAIELYPDFAKAYMNRAYAENMLGMKRASERDYQTARQKVREYQAQSASGSFADTTRKYSSLLALDAEFAKKDFDDELLQHRDIDIRLKPLYKFVLAADRAPGQTTLRTRYENPLIEKFSAESPVPVRITGADTLRGPETALVEEVLYGENSHRIPQEERDFLKALGEIGGKRFNGALAYYDKAVDAQPAEKYRQMYQAFYLMNRGVLRAEMIDFIASMENNVQTLSMDDKGTVRARVKENVTRTYDYSEAIADMEAAAARVQDIPYIHFNLGNLYCLSSRLVEAIDSYTRAVDLYPGMGDAYYNRGLVLIYLKDKEKGCIDLSHAGELGVQEAYSVISKYCEEERND